MHDNFDANAALNETLDKDKKQGKTGTRCRATAPLHMHSMSAHCKQLFKSSRLIQNASKTGIEWCAHVLWGLLRQTLP
jgi:hypothetical protein